MATSVPGQQRSFLRSMQKGPGQDRNKSLHLSGKQTTVRLYFN